MKRITKSGGKEYHYDYELYHLRLTEESLEALRFLQDIGVNAQNFLNQNLIWLYRHFMLEDYGTIETKKKILEADLQNEHMVSGYTDTEPKK